MNARPFVVVAVLLACTPIAASVPLPDQAQKIQSSTFKQDMRKLWTDHVVWTRDYIVAAVADAPDQQAAATRLLKNQEDVGAAMAGFYGKAGDNSVQSAADAKWKTNATAIADFLSKANPNWPRATLVDLMNKHLATTTDEVVARLTKNWDADVRAYDAVYAHILMMSDALADGIIKQFPDRFGHGD